MLLTSLSIPVEALDGVIEVEGIEIVTASADISSTATNIYIDEIYSNEYLYSPRVSELHMGNNGASALWNPYLEELPSTLYASVMHQAGIAILYDGWIDLERTENYKPFGATRAGEVLGYDVYAKSGEVFQLSEDESTYLYSNGGIYSGTENVTYPWVITNLYRSIGVVRYNFYVTTEGRSVDEFNINTSPLSQYLSMSTSGPDLTAVITTVSATRTNQDVYVALSQADGIFVGTEQESLTVAEFAVLAATLMNIYGEPVLTQTETRLLLEAYGSELPYSLSSIQQESAEYLIARGIAPITTDWEDDLTFELATEFLLRIKDVDSRLTLKEITLTTDLGLLDLGYYPVEISDQYSPIAVIDVAPDYAAYTEYDYFVECPDSIQFKTASGYTSMPFIGDSEDNASGQLEGTSYLGRVQIGDKEYYHFRANQITGAASGDVIYINTTVADDSPYRYILPAYEGGVWSYTGTQTQTTVTDWEYSTLDSTDAGHPVFTSEYCDVTRKTESILSSSLELGLFSASSFGYTIRVHKDDISGVQCTLTDGSTAALPSSTSTVLTLTGGTTIQKAVEQPNSEYVYYTVKGNLTRTALLALFECSNDEGFQVFAAFAKENEQYLVSIEYLKSIGVLWEFAQTSDSTYYLGVVATDAAGYTHYTDVYLGVSGDASYAIRGSQMQVFEPDRQIVVDASGDFYVDYAAVIGVSTLSPVRNSEGIITLDSPVSPELISWVGVTTSNVDDSGTPEMEWLATVCVEYATGVYRYVYSPITYPLANWLVVDTYDGRGGIFSFYASEYSDMYSTAADSLRSILGIELTDSSWRVNYTSLPPKGTTLISGTDTLSAEGDTPASVLYWADQEAYLILIPDVASTYGDFVAIEGGTAVTTLFKNADNSVFDWNYNLYYDDDAAVLTGYALHYDHWCDLSEWASGSIYTCGTSYVSCSIANGWAAAPAGIPALVGYPLTAYNTNSLAVDVYSGIAHTVRNGAGTALYNYSIVGGDASETLRCVITHSTPNKSWLQSCGFKFQYLANSPLSDTSTGAPQLVTGDATTPVDWEDMFTSNLLQDADDWLTIAIIATLTLLPRLFIFAFLLLMALALIADVKPWQAFCDAVIDPYKILTLGRRDVHTINVKAVFMYSMIALGLFGLFQNGLILDVISWMARAVTGILSR